MPQPNKIPLAFAASGDKNIIPKSTETTGLASWRDGFPAITSVPFSEGGIAPKRADFNGIFNALSQAVLWMQQGGVYAYDADTDYEAGNVVLDAGGLYVANAANGPSSAVVQPSLDTTGATWKPVRLDLATQSAAGYMSAEDKAALDGIPTTYLPLSGGILTGDLGLPGELSFTGSSPVVNAGGADHYLRLGNGNSSSLYANGASLYLYGANATANQGGFILNAFNGSLRRQLAGSPDGTLKWGDNKVMTAADVNFTVVTSGTVSVPTNTNTNITSFTFAEPGIYATVYASTFRSTNTSGVRQLTVSATSGGSNIDDSAVFVTNPPSAGYCFIQLPRLEKITTANTTRYLVALQTTSNSMNVTGTIQVVRVGDA